MDTWSLRLRYACQQALLPLRLSAQAHPLSESSCAGGGGEGCESCTRRNVGRVWVHLVVYGCLQPKIQQAATGRENGLGAPACRLYMSILGSPIGSWTTSRSRSVRLTSCWTWKLLEDDRALLRGNHDVAYHVNPAWRFLLRPG
jgi:hypothetical protein